jgi:ribonuclease HI
MIWEMSLPAGKLCSSYSSECVALKTAMEWINGIGEDTGIPALAVLICTDSLSLVSALQNNNWKDKDPWLKTIKHLLRQTETNITLLWIPSHCDIPGNERADELAKLGSALNQDNVPITHRIIKAKIKNKKWTV